MNEIMNSSSQVPAEFRPGLFDRWTAYIDASEKTVQTYTRAIKQFALYLEETGTERPDRGTVIAFRDKLISEGRKASTVNLYLIATKQFFKWTAAEGLYPNIADHVKGEKTDGAEAYKKDYLTGRQAGQLLTAARERANTEKGKRDFAILYLMITTGLRDIEVSRANIEDLRQAGDAGQVLYIQGKGQSDRQKYVKVIPEVQAAILDYLKERRKGGRIPGTAALFASTANRNGGGRMTTRAISGIVKAALRGIGLDSDRMTAHSLRHTAATLNLKAGGTVEETRQLLRHKSVSTTMIYAHMIERENNQSENRIGAAIIF